MPPLIYLTSAKRKAISTAALTKIALVTGGSRQLGRDMVLSLARKEIDVIFNYRTNKAEAKIQQSRLKVQN